MKIEVYCDKNESLSNIGFVKAMVESGLFTVEDLQEICGHLYVLSFVFGSKNRRTENDKAK